MLQRYFLIIATCLIFSLSSSCATQSNNVSSDTADYTNMAWDALIAGNYDRTIDYSSRAISQNKKLAESYLVRGMGYQGKKDYNRAIQDLSMSISIESINVTAYYVRAQVYGDMGNWNQARKDYETAFKQLVVIDDAS